MKHMKCIENNVERRFYRLLTNTGLAKKQTVNGITTTYLFAIYRDIKGEQEISRDFFLPRPFETFLIILHHELASDARLPKKSRKDEVRKRTWKLSVLL